MLLLLSRLLLPTSTGQWVEQTTSAPWSLRHDAAFGVSPNGTLFISAGRDTTTWALHADVWASTNGIDWVERTASAEFSARGGSSMTIGHDGTMYIIGGANETDIIGDVWRSFDDGATWFEVAKPLLYGGIAPWRPFSQVATTVMLDGTLVIAGGVLFDLYGNLDKINAVYSSADGGVHWEARTIAAEWSPRSNLCLVTAPDGSLFVAGGSLITTSTNEVWRSSNGGSNWVLVASGPAIWEPRESFGAVFTASGLFIIGCGGDSGDGGKPQMNDVWISSDTGVTWKEAPTPKWTARRQCGMLITPSRGEVHQQDQDQDQLAIAAAKEELYVIGGARERIALNDVWSIDARVFDPPPSSPPSPPSSGTFSSTAKFVVIICSSLLGGIAVVVAIVVALVLRSARMSAKGREQQVGTELMREALLLPTTTTTTSSGGEIVFPRGPLTTLRRRCHEELAALNMSRTCDDARRGMQVAGTFVGTFNGSTALQQLYVEESNAAGFLGRGRFGTVTVGWATTGLVGHARVSLAGGAGCFVAVKTTMSTKDAAAADEAEVLRSVQGHPNIVCMHGVMAGGYVSQRLVMELCVGSLSAESLDQVTPVLRELIASDLTLQLRLALGVMKGLAHLHDNSVSHRDLKPSNTLISFAEHRSMENPYGFEVKLSDFGIAKCTPSPGDASLSMTTMRGTVGWRAPELYSMEVAFVDQNEQSTESYAASGAALKPKMTTMRGFMTADAFAAGLLIYYLFAKTEFRMFGHCVERSEGIAQQMLKFFHGYLDAHHSEVIGKVAIPMLAISDSDAPREHHRVGVCVSRIVSALYGLTERLPAERWYAARAADELSTALAGITATTRVDAADRMGSMRGLLPLPLPFKPFNYEQTRVIIFCIEPTHFALAGAYRCASCYPEHSCLVACTLSESSSAKEQLDALKEVLQKVPCCCTVHLVSDSEDAACAAVSTLCEQIAAGALPALRVVVAAGRAFASVDVGQIGGGDVDVISWNSRYIGSGEESDASNIFVYQLHQELAAGHSAQTAFVAARLAVLCVATWRGLVAGRMKIFEKRFVFATEESGEMYSGRTSSSESTTLAEPMLHSAAAGGCGGV